MLVHAAFKTNSSCARPGRISINPQWNKSEVLCPLKRRLSINRRWLFNILATVTQRLKAMIILGLQRIRGSYHIVSYRNRCHFQHWFSEFAGYSGYFLRFFASEQNIANEPPRCYSRISQVSITHSLLPDIPIFSASSVLLVHCAILAKILIFLPTFSALGDFKVTVDLMQECALRLYYCILH